MKPGNTKGFGFLLVLVLAAAGIFAFRWQAGQASRTELEQLRLRNKLLSLEASENHHPLGAPLASTDIAKLKSDQQAATLLRREIDDLREKQKAVAVAPTKSPAKVAPSAPEFVRTITNSLLPPSEWKLAGAATPAATLETSLWAAANGEIETLAGLLILEGDARVRADALLSKVSPQIRAQYSSPERIVALFTAKDVPLGGAQISDPENVPGGERKVLGARLKNVDGTSRVATFSLRQEGAEWKLVVPPKAVEKYEAMLSGAGGGGSN
ncbi:MAG: hypothetical protein ABIO94_02745 [Opitutaceae bacterium]